MDTSQLDIVDGHTYWQHPGERNFKHAPMVNDPFNSTVVELSRTAVAGKPYTVSVVNNPFPSQFASEGIPILVRVAVPFTTGLMFRPPMRLSPETPTA